jgi:hypothetical protein
VPFAPATESATDASLANYSGDSAPTASVSETTTEIDFELDSQFETTTDDLGLDSQLETTY